MKKQEKIYKIPTYRLQLVRDGSIKSTTINSAQDVLKSIKQFTRSDREIFVCLYLNTRNQIIAYQETSTGSLNANLVHPREVFKTAIIKNAASIVVAHNHPSGGIVPSEADRELTKRLVECGKLMGIEVIDHLVVAPDGRYESISVC